MKIVNNITYVYNASNRNVMWLLFNYLTYILKRIIIFEEDIKL